jgi:hypothetical protein
MVTLLCCLVGDGDGAVWWDAPPEVEDDDWREKETRVDSLRPLETPPPPDAAEWRLYSASELLPAVLKLANDRRRPPVAPPPQMYEVSLEIPEASELDPSS